MGSIYHMKIKTMIMLAAICFAIIPMVIYAVYVGNSTSGSSTAELEKQLTDLVNNQIQVLIHMQTL